MNLVPGELIVGFRTGYAEATGAATLNQALPKFGGAISKSPAYLRNLLQASEQSALVQAPQAYLIKVKDNSPQGMAEATAKLKAIKGVQFVEPNGIVRIPEPPPGEKPVPAQVKPQSLTNDPLLNYQWGYFNIIAFMTPPATDNSTNHCRH